METEGALPDIDGQAVPVVEALRQYEVEVRTPADGSYLTRLGFKLA
jgi:hypothetical protein